MKWRAYLSIVRIRLIAGLQYRATAIAGSVIQMFWGIMLVVIFMLFYKYGQRGDLQMTLAQGVTYIWLVQCFLNFVPMQMDTEVYQKISSGDFAYELCRPLDVYSHWFARIAAIRIANVITRSTITLLVCILLPAPYGIMPPASLWVLFATILALCGSLLLSCAFTNLMNVFFLKIELGPGLNSLMLSTIVVFSGMIVPLSIFPDWLQPILRALPFAGLIDFPCALYTGLIPVTAAWTVYARQLVWIVILVWLGRWLLKMGLRRTVIQGG